MAEQFHQWVNNMPWYERLYYELFDPNSIRCSTYTPPFIQLLFWAIIIIAVTSVVFFILYRREGHKSIDSPVSLEKSDVKE